MTLVLDNSVALAWCFADERSPASLDLLDRVAQSGAHAPQLWPVEALNGLLSAERRRRITIAERHALMTFLQDLPITIDAGTADRAWRETAHLAASYNLTAYDATYLELALRLGLPLATNDAALISAAQQAGVKLVAVA